MKKIINCITATAIMSFISLSVCAQTEMKPAIDETGKPKDQDKTTAQAALEPQIVATPQKLKVTETTKPIVPGGEFTPRDTNKPVVPANIRTDAANDQPVLPVIKKAGPAPVVTEQQAGAAAQDRAKPAPTTVILQKQL